MQMMFRVYISAFSVILIYCQLNSVPEGPLYARLCSGHMLPAIRRDYANIPTQCGGGLFRFAFIRKTLSSRYFKQCKKLERLSVTWNVKKGSWKTVRLGREGGTERIQIGWERREKDSGQTVLCSNVLLGVLNLSFLTNSHGSLKA